MNNTSLNKYRIYILKYTKTTTKKQNIKMSLILTNKKNSSEYIYFKFDLVS